MRDAKRVWMFLPAVLALCLGCASPAEEPTAETDTTPIVSAPAGMPELVSITGTGTPQPPSDAGNFTFWVWGDNRDGGTHFSEVLDKVKKAQPAFVFSLGDIIEGEPQADSIDKHEITADLSSWASSVAATGVPVFNAPGNHEMIAKTMAGKECPNETMQELYRDNASSTLYGAFTYGNSRFIVLNTDDYPVNCSSKNCPICDPCISSSDSETASTQTDEKPPWECSFIGQDQLDQLAADLAANADKTHIFIGMHYPLKPYNPQDRLIDTVAANLNAIINAHQTQHKNITFILASHEHLYFNPQQKPNKAIEVGDEDDGYPPKFKVRAGGDPYYLVSGGAGAPLTKDTPGSFYHYLVFDVDGGDVTVTLVDLGT